VLLVALVIVLLTIGLEPASESSTAPAAGTARPALRIMGLNPLTVGGRSFKAGERVVLSVGPRRRTATATTRGRFLVRFSRGRCISGTVVAVGSRGSRASVLVPHTVCFQP
jgi:hypothetical protein